MRKRGPKNEKTIYPMLHGPRREKHGAQVEISPMDHIVEVAWSPNTVGRSGGQCLAQFLVFSFVFFYCQCPKRSLFARVHNQLRHQCAVPGQRANQKTRGRRLNDDSVKCTPQLKLQLPRNIKVPN